MSRSYVALHFDFLEMTETLTEAELGRLVKAMLAYGRDGRADEAALVGNERFLFPVFRRQIDRDVSAYETRVVQNALNGRKGGRPRKYESDEKNPTVFLETEKTQEQEEEQDQEQEKEKEKEQDKEREGEGPRLAGDPLKRPRRTGDLIWGIRNHPLRPDSLSYPNTFLSAIFCRMRWKRTLT